MRKKKLVSVFVCVMLILGTIFIPKLKVDAENNTPVAVVNSITVDKTSATVGGKIKIRAQISNITTSGKVHVNIIYKKPITGNEFYISLNESTTPNLFEGELSVTSWNESGAWQVKGLSIEGSNGEVTEYSRDTLSLLTGGDFQISGTTPDTTAPSLNSISIDKKYGFPGDKIKITADASDVNGSGINEIGAIIYSKGKNESQYIELSLNSSTKKYEGVITLRAEDVTSWEISTVYMVDNVQNVVEIINMEPEVSAPILKGCKFDVLSKGGLTNGWNYLYGDWYYYNSSQGSFKTGWLSYNNNKYYLDDTGKMKTGWLTLDGKRYLDDSGKLCYGWLSYGGNWYYLDVKNDGKVKTGWLLYNNAWYYMLDNGTMATGWVNDRGTWYYLTSSGVMQTGWLYYNGAWYYLNGGGAMVTGWVQTGGKWYYMYPSGAMAANTVIGGYRLSSSGAWIP
jgi:glucan-binding YG repeat protein